MYRVFGIYWRLKGWAAGAWDIQDDYMGCIFKKAA